MRKWLVMAGLAAAILVVVLLVPNSGRPPQPGAPGPAPGAPGPAPGAPGHAPGASSLAPGTPGPAAAAPHPGTESGAAGMALHQAPVDDGTRAVLSYQFTMERLKAYVAAVAEIRGAGQRDAALLARLRQPANPGDGPAAMAARLDAIAPVKAILDRHGLAGIDLVLMPRAVAVGQNAYALEQEGRPLPDDQVNAAATALYRADLPRMDELAKAFRADLKFLRGG